MGYWKNRRNAWKYFYPEGEGKAKKGYHLHHIDTTLKYNDPIRYSEWRVEDLVMLSTKEHLCLHLKGKPLTKEHIEKRQKNRTYKKGKENPNFGKHISEKHRQKLIVANLNRVFSEETRKKMSESAKGREAWNKGKKLKPLSEETRKKISLANKGKVRSEETRKKISESSKGRIISDEQRKKISDTLKKYHEKQRHEV